MEKGFQSWFNSQQADWQAFNLNSSSAQFEFGHQHSVFPLGNTCTNMFLPDVRSGSFPPFAFSAQQPSKASLPIPNERHNWFYCMPRFRAVNSMPKEKFVVDEKSTGVGVGVGASNGVQKRFLVFDQSGDDKTALIFSSVNGAPAHCLPQPQCAFESKKEEIATKGENVHSYLPSPVEECSEESEMHEDTEELNALLYSDSDDEIDSSDKDEEEEEASTGHSPCTMTVHKYVNVNGNGEEEEEEEVASCGGHVKRQKLWNGGYDVLSLGNSSSSLKTKCTVDYKDDKNEEIRASDESDSVSGNKRLFSTKDKVLGESDSMLDNKRVLSRKDKVRETISVLQNLIPGLKECEEPMVVIDEAIHYLRLLKAKAQDLGLD